METMNGSDDPRRSFSKEFKKDAMDLVRWSGKTIAEVVAQACQLLEVSRSTYYQWSRHVPSRRQLDDEALSERIQAAAGPASSRGLTRSLPGLAEVMPPGMSP